MAFEDYFTTPALNTTIGGSIFIGPNMQRTDVREALQQLAADGRALSDVVVDAALATATPPENYFTTRAAGAAAIATDDLFSSDEEGQMAVYRRTAVAPNYTKLYDVATKAMVDSAVASVASKADQADLDDLEDAVGATAAGDLAPQGSLLPYMPNGFRTYGDSQTAQIVSGVTGWRTIVRDRLGTTNTDRSVSGGSVMDWGKNALGDTIVAGDWSMILPGFNDLRANGANATKAESYRLALAASAAWLAIPAARKTVGSALSRTGTWTVGASDYTTAIQSGTAASTATFSVEGTAVYIAGLSILSSGGSFTATVDGVDYRFTCDRAVGNGGAVSADTFAPALFRVPNLGSGKHTVTITVDGTGNVYILWVAGSNMQGGSGASVVIGNTLRMNATGAAVGAPYNQYSEAGQRLYSKGAEQVVNELSSDGLAVYYADAAGAYDPDTQTHTDNIHMAQTGQTGVSNAFLAALDLRSGSQRPSLAGTLTPDAIEAAGPILSSGGLVGYTARAGGAVTQATSKSTGVTLNKPSGAITMNNAALADVTTVVFTVTNSFVAATDTVIVGIKSGHATAGTYLVWAETFASGSFKIAVRNVSGGSLGEALVLNFAVIKGSAT